VLLEHAARILAVVGRRGVSDGVRGVVGTGGRVEAGRGVVEAVGRVVDAEGRLWRAREGRNRRW